MIKTRTEAISVLQSHSVGDWGEVRAPEGWEWHTHIEGERPILRVTYGLEQCITRNNVFAPAPQISNIEQLGYLVDLKPTAGPECSSQRFERIVTAAVAKINALNKPARDERLDSTTFDQFEMLVHGITALMPSPAAYTELPEQPEAILAWVTQLSKSDKSALIRDFVAQLYIAEGDIDKTGIMFSLTEVSQFAEKYCSDEILPPTFTPLYANDPATQRTEYNNGDACCMGGNLIGVVVGKHPERDDSVVVWHYQKRGLKVYHPHQITLMPPRIEKAIKLRQFITGKCADTFATASKKAEWLALADNVEFTDGE